ncbi:peptide-methionine (S)-S-oxide reductase MsrA [Bradyrhizobium prioriisuperbiae]|uniref:peptide-methionine (S)-S-oxide reductase MsrA n=1 Tax=Bradyrhizobium prioriisuperbiae TaxID=2854389 RepID=UPI003899322D
MPSLPLRRMVLTAAAGAVLLSSAWIGPSRAAEDAVVIPAPTADLPAADGTQTAVLAGGCFWGVQGVYQHTKGVLNAVSGYAGGAKETANYSASGTGATGHAESVQVTYDPKVISYGKLLQIYFSVVHDPTQLNRQGPDSGTQYRSTIFVQNDAQKKIAEAYIAQLNTAKTFKKPIATTVESGKPFFVGEEYHQDYLTLHPNQPYIVYNDAPKIEALKKIFADNYRDKPVLVRDAKATN